MTRSEDQDRSDDPERDDAHDQLDDQDRTDDQLAAGGQVRTPHVGDVVFGDPRSPVAVCTLASRSLLQSLAGRPEVAIAGRCHTENVGVERMVQNLVANPSLCYLLLCGRETSHLVGQTVVGLHRYGLDADRRVVGSRAPEPVLPNLSADDLRAFRERVVLIDMIGELDADAILARARELVAAPAPDRPAQAREPSAETASLEHVVAVPDPPDQWQYDPAGYFLVFVDRERGRLLAEHHAQDHRRLRTIEGPSAQAITQTIARLGYATVPAHLTYLGRELMKAELALQLGLRYEQDVALSPNRPA